MEQLKNALEREETEEMKNNIQNKSATQIKKEISKSYLCPITQCIMKEPVVAEDGQTYERSAIREWFRMGKNVSPLTGATIGKRLVPNHCIKSAISQLRTL